MTGTLERHLADLETPTPVFAAWGLRRIGYTVGLLRRWLPPGSRVVDVGGEPYFTYLATRSLPGVDWVPTSMEEGPADLPGRDGGTAFEYRPSRLVLDGGPVEFPGGAPDAVTMFELLEHLPWNPGPMLASACDALRPRSGLLVLSTPNLGSVASLSRLMGSGSPHQTPMLEPGSWYHRKEYTPWELRELLRWAGYDLLWHGTADLLRSDPGRWRRAACSAGLLAAAALAMDGAAARHLLRFPGSTQFAVARAARRRGDGPPPRL